MLGEEPSGTSGDASPVSGLDPAAGDAGLVARLVAGDEGALAALYDLHGAALLGVARRILHNAAAAEDLLHDVFLEAWHRAADYDPARGSVRGWLMVRLRSRALDRLAQHTRDVQATTRLGRISPAAGADALGHGEPSPGARLDGVRARQAVAELPKELVAVLELAYFEGLSASEIAGREGIPIGTVKSRLARAIGLLRTNFGLDREATA